MFRDRADEAAGANFNAESGLNKAFSSFRGGCLEDGIARVLIEQEDSSVQEAELIRDGLDDVGEQGVQLAQAGELAAALKIDPGDLLRPGRVVEILLLPGIVDLDGQPLQTRPGRNPGGAIDVLRFQIAPTGLVGN